jgi:hypothetical protein
MLIEEDPRIRQTPLMSLPHPILGERIARHGFATRPAADPAAAAALVCGIQAQDGPASRLGVRARCGASADQDVLDAIAERRVVRTWLMRNTIHLVAAADIRWMTALLGPMIRRRFQTVRWPELGLTPALLEAAAGMTPEVLAGQALTRHELAAALVEHGVPVPTDGQAPTHLLVYLSTVGLTCRGIDRGRDATFVLLEEWLPDAPAGPRGDDALTELARRYFAAFSPATAADFTTWSGLPSSRAIETIRDELSETDVFGRPGYRLGEVEPAHGVRLLPAFDNYLVGYAVRSFIDDTRRGEVYVGGVIRPTVLRDGRVVGRWRLVKGAVEITPFEPFDGRTASAIEKEIADITGFLTAPGRSAARRTRLLPGAR